MCAAGSDTLTVPSGLEQADAVEGSTGPSRSVDPWLLLGVAALLLAVAHGWMVHAMRAPLVQPDEASYLGNASYLVAGEGATGIRYYLGYSLALVPARLLASDPYGFYKLALTTNVALAACLPFALYGFLREVLPGSRRVGSAVVAVAVSLYPMAFLAPVLAMSENLFVPLYAVAALAVARAAARPDSTARWVTAALLSGACFWVTPRGIVVVAAFVIVVAIGVRPWRSRAAVAAVVTSAACVVAALVANHLVPADREVFGDGEGGFLSPLLNGLATDRLRTSTANLFGRGFYLGLATAGVALVGMAWAGMLAWRAVRARRADPLTLTAAYLFVGIGATWFVGATGAGSYRFDHLLYGRYVENLLAPLLALTLAILVVRPPALPVLRRWHIALTATGVLLLAWLSTLAPPPPWTGVSFANLLVVLGLARWLDPPGLLLYGLVGACVTALVLMLARERPLIAVVTLGALFAVLSGSVFWYFAPASETRMHQRVLLTALDRLDDAGVDIGCVGDDRTILSPWHFYNYVLFGPESRFEEFDSFSGEEPCGRAVLTSRVDLDDDYPGARFVSVENDAPVGLWVLPASAPGASEPPMEELQAAGLLLPVDPGVPLPDDAYRSTRELRLDGRPPEDVRLRRGRGVDATLRVAHVGSASPWPSLADMPDTDGRGSVQIELTWTAERGDPVASQRVLLPRPLLPGESVDVPFRLDVPEVDAAGVPLRAGEHGLEVSLVQEGVADFAEHGDAPVRYEVALG